MVCGSWTEPSDVNDAPGPRSITLLQAVAKPSGRMAEQHPSSGQGGAGASGVGAYVVMWSRVTTVEAADADIATQTSTGLRAKSRAASARSPTCRQGSVSAGVKFGGQKSSALPE